MEFMEGKIIDSNEEEENSYIIEHITAGFEEDRPEMTGVLRCTEIEICSDAPSELNSKAEEELYNAFADAEYNDAESDGVYREEARVDISKRTGVDISKIEIE